MKDFFGPILISVFLSVPVTGSAQGYTAFDLETTLWNMHKVYPTLGPGDGGAYWRIFPSSDTSINGKQYVNLRINKHCSTWYNASGDPFSTRPTRQNGFLIGGIREEAKRIYFYRYDFDPLWLEGYESALYDLGGDQEHLLYDFDFTVGDTIHFSNNEFTIIEKELSSKYGRKRYEVTPSTTSHFPEETGYWIEGVGSSFGLFGSYYSRLTSLRCLQIGAEKIINNTPCSQCFASPPQPEQKPGVFPNPFWDYLIFSAKDSTGIHKVEILDLAGRLVEAYRFNGKQKRHSASVSHLQRAHVYLVRVTFGDGTTMVEKVLKR